MHPQLEMDEKSQKLETLQSKISELKKCSNIPETPAKLQVLEMTSSLILWLLLVIATVIHAFFPHSPGLGE